MFPQGIWYPTLPLLYTPSVLLAKLSSRIHNSFQKPLSMGIEDVTSSIPLNAQWRLLFLVQTTTKIKVWGKTVGIPDLFLEFQDTNGDVKAFWVIKVTFTQTNKDIMTKIQGYMKKCKDLVSVTIIDACKLHPYQKPKDTLAVAAWAQERDVLTFMEWCNDDDIPAYGPVMSNVPYQWASPLTITIKIWV
ncbi:uncharacterized protein BJ212DRAFT_1485962 [Suillus subaureus]|uniref:Uncharacterized protein n=1 Tax=Suillus subaureus TaxID=48587 RepID=A0A9P7DY18_9AGAM|nr:uncharacterized protein BJ212DRAFT_1485962 [Suillus subaureus]KAG1806205.1 hypothetical protein BJ212DRAFT_1485962 [Suillus subaureus]